MLSTWKNIIAETLSHKNSIHTSGKKIARTLTHTEKLSEFLVPDLTLNMLGYTKRKIGMLTEYYYHEESVNVALTQLAGRREAGTFGSCGVTTYNHFAKKERPTHGPCIQSLVFTHTPPGIIHVDVFYRVTEVFKKFAADLIWLQTVMLPQFKVEGEGTITFHFAQAVFHPMYWALIVPYIENPTEELIKISKSDPMIYRGILRWMWRFVNKDPGLENFRQGFRVSKHLHRLTDPEALQDLKDYINSKYTPKKHRLEEVDENEQSLEFC